MKQFHLIVKRLFALFFLLASAVALKAQTSSTFVIAGEFNGWDVESGIEMEDINNEYVFTAVVPNLTSNFMIYQDYNPNVAIGMASGAVPSLDQEFRVQRGGSWIKLPSNVKTIKNAYITYDYYEGTVKIQDGVPQTEVKVVLDDTRVNVCVGQTKTLYATVYPWGVQDEVEWSSSNESIVTVERDDVYDIHCHIKGIREGEAIVTATCAGKTAKCFITVIPTPELSLDKETLDVQLGKRGLLKATLNPDIEDAEIEWESSDESVATCDEGWIYTYKVGTTTITASIGGVSASCLVTVTKDPVAGAYEVTLNHETLTIPLGQQDKLTATVTPYVQDAEYDIEWTSSNELVAVVINGYIYPQRPGTTVITATYEAASATCLLTVTSPDMPDDLKLTLDRESLVLGLEDQDRLVATLTPNVDEAIIDWSSSNESVATCSYGIIYPRSTGTTVITASFGNVSASCNVTVIEGSIDDVNITLNKETLALEVGQEETLVATVGSDAEAKVTWTSSDEAVATVDGNGKVVAVAAGEATIKATCDDAEATCVVTVTEAAVVYTIALDKATAEVEEEKTIELVATLTPAKEDAVYTWTSSDEEVATVADGVVTGVKAGTATIKVEAEGVEATCEVTVLPKAGIEALFVDGAQYDVYTVEGVLVLRGADFEAFRALGAGLYVVNGQKVLVK